jgi:DNA-directed RNA polymerase specialized sigma24 family protein
MPACGRSKATRDGATRRARACLLFRRVLRLLHRDRREPVDRIWAAIAELELELRVPLLLRETGGLSYAEIADTLALSIPTVRRRIALARQQLVDVVGGQACAAGDERRTPGDALVGERR